MEEATRKKASVPTWDIFLFSFFPWQRGTSTRCFLLHHRSWDHMQLLAECILFRFLLLCSFWVCGVHFADPKLKSTPEISISRTVSISAKTRSDQSTLCKKVQFLMVVLDFWKKTSVNALGTLVQKPEDSTDGNCPPNLGPVMHRETENSPHTRQRMRGPLVMVVSPTCCRVFLSFLCLSFIFVHLLRTKWLVWSFDTD